MIDVKINARRGRPDRSVRVKILGAIPSSASATSTLEEMYMDTEPTEHTQMRTTALRISGRTEMPASLMAMTNGDAAAFLVVERREGWLLGTTKVMKRRDVM